MNLGDDGDDDDDLLTNGIISGFICAFVYSTAIINR